VERPPESDILLRDVTEDDLVIFFEQQQDPVANRMAAFTGKDPNDWAAFAAKWAKILGDRTVKAKTIVCGGLVAGTISTFIAPWSGQCEITYWIGREYWGRGMATKALAEFVGQLAERPLQARAAADNLASIRVLEKCGFIRIGRDTGFAEARGEEIEEVVLELRAAAQQPVLGATLGPVAQNCANQENPCSTT
jgi:RimJ/RimL family protein N-acetyltransferase